MRVLLVSHHQEADALALVPLAWALRTAGHEVRFATRPAMVDTVASAGMTVVPVGEDHRLPGGLQGSGDLPELLSAASGQLSGEALGRWYRDVVGSWWGPVNDPVTADLVTFCRQWGPDLVVWEAVSFAGAVAAEACGAAHARFVRGVDLLARLRDRFLAALPERPPAEREDPLAAWLSSQASAFGVEFSEVMTRGQVTVDHLPGALRLPAGEFDGPPPEYVPVRFVPCDGRSVVPGWLREPPERPRVCLTLDPSALAGVGASAVTVADLLWALADLDAEVVVSVPERAHETPPRVPRNTRLAPAVPLHALAPTCAAVVNVGGPGTLHTAVVHGVPQLVVATLLDEALLAERLAASGAGLTLTGGEATPEEVRDAVERLLEDGDIAAAAGRLRDEARALPSPNEAAGQLERLAGQPARPR